MHTMLINTTQMLWEKQNTMKATYSILFTTDMDNYMKNDEALI